LSGVPWQHSFAVRLSRTRDASGTSSLICGGTRRWAFAREAATFCRESSDVHVAKFRDTTDDVVVGADSSRPAGLALPLLCRHGEKTGDSSTDEGCSGCSSGQRDAPSAPERGIERGEEKDTPSGFPLSFQNPPPFSFLSHLVFLFPLFQKHLQQQQQLLFLITLVAAAAAAALSLVASNTRTCDCCKGFGVCRCPVCKGRGRVAFEGKYIHSADACPRCLGARAISCPDCGGLFGRRALFSHSRFPRLTAGVASSVDPGGLAKENKRKTNKRREAPGGGGGLFAAFVGKRGNSRGAAAADASSDEEEEDDQRRWLGFGAETTLAD